MPTGLPAALLRATRTSDGLFTLTTARAHGVSSRKLTYLLGLEVIERVHPALYRVVGPPWSAQAKQRAASMAAPAGAGVSHRGAAAWLGMPGFTAAVPEITCVNRRPARRGVLVHRVRELDDVDVTVQRGVRCTTGPRTLVDLARLLGSTGAIAATDGAICAGIASRGRVQHRASALLPGRPWAEPLITVTAPGAEGVFWSALERHFAECLLGSGLPMPRWNAALEHAGRTLYADALWQAQRLVVELHGLAFHASPVQRGRDDERLNAFTELELRTLVFGWRQVTEDFPTVAAAIGRALRAGRI